MSIVTSCTACGQTVRAINTENQTECPQCGAEIPKAEQDGGTPASAEQEPPLLDWDTAVKTEEPSADADTTLNLFADGTSAPTAAARKSRSQSVRKPGGKPSTRQAEQMGSAADSAVVSRRLFLLVVSYASAITIAFILLLIRQLQPNIHALESLPDLEPPQKDGKIAVQLVPPDAELPRGHTLSLNESQRFGNIRLTPLRVTRGPLQFSHFSGNSQRRHPESGPVLKLWLQLENVSEDQTFAPLDRKLMLTRVPDGETPGRFRANTFLADASAPASPDSKLLVYDMPETSEWDLEGQDAGRALKPGESYVTYIPTSEEDSKELADSLVWRVHFRKGYHTESGRGVTTLVDVVFRANQIQDDLQGEQFASR